MAFPRTSYRKIAIEEKQHSPEFIEETLKYAEILETQDLPVIFSTLHLSMLVGVNFQIIKGIISNTNSHYTHYEIKKRKGGKRPISSPRRTLKKIQTWINTEILSKIEINENAYGFVPKKSIADNAKTHIGQECILNIDLLDFFDSIPEKRIYGIFKAFGYHTNLAVDLAKLCTSKRKTLTKVSFSLDSSTKISTESLIEKTFLPQGAVTSPSLSNIVARRLDKRLSGYAGKNNLKYSRYADDITLSGNGENIIKISALDKIVREEGFQINSKKTKLFKKEANKKIVTGLIVSDTVRIPKKFKKEVERHLFFCQKYGVESHIKYLENKYSYEKGYFKDWLRGKICFIFMVEPQEGEKLFEKFNNIEWGF